MNEPAIGNLIERFNHLERRNRWLQRIGTAMILGMAAIVLMGQGKSVTVAKVLEADRLALRDSNGKVRAILGIAEDDTNFLRFYDKDGRPRLAMALAADGEPILSLTYKDGKPALTLTELADKTALYIYDKNGNSIIGLVREPLGSAMLTLAQNDKTRMSLLATGTCQAYLFSTHTEGQR